jgi:dTDP-4-amino-4,6-dideoxygalactose transaminase
MGVPLLDLRAQYAGIRDEIDSAIAGVVESQGFVLGPVVAAFESAMADYLGSPHAIGCASGTDALLLPLLALEPKPGDEVVLPAFTFFATAGAVWNAGFKPVFCDIDPDTFNVTAEALDAARTARTRAVVPVHLFGQMAPMAEITDWAAKHDIFVLEDAAQAVGARQVDGGGWRMAGTIGDAGAFSFFPTKNLGAFGDGGMVTTPDDDFAERIRKLRVHGGRQMYHHEMVGTNSRLDALQAAVLHAKLPHLEAWSEARIRNARRYVERLSGVAEVTLPVTAEGNHHVYNQYTIRTPRRDALKDALQERGIGCGVYYPVPLHRQDCFTPLGFGEGDLPVSEQACREVLSLPVFPELGNDRIDAVAQAIADFHTGV